MAKRKNAADWQAFLGALRRTGNVRVAARAAEMDAGTAYDRRIKNDGFRARWAAALAKAPKRRPGRKPAGPELVARRSKRHGLQMVRAAPGRWSAAAERRFLDALRHTGCVRAAARASGLSTTTLYNRRKHYPDFAAAWAAAEAEAATRVPALLTAATIASLDPESEEDDLPRVNIDQAIAICRLKGPGSKLGKSWSGRGAAPPARPPIEATRANIMRKLDAIEAHGKRQDGGDGEGDPFPSSQDA